MKTIITLTFLLLFPVIIYSQTHSTLKNLGPGNINGIPKSTQAAFWNNNYYFVGTATGSRERIYRTDGTTANTIAVTPDQQYGIYNMRALPDYLIFDGTEGNDYGIFTSDGTTGGTTLVKEIDYSVEFMTNLDADKIIFITQDFSNDSTYLWVSDGTSSGTQNLGNYHIKVDFLEYSRFGDHIIFTERSTNSEIFPPVMTDGTLAGTMLVKDYVNSIVTNDITSVETAVGIEDVIFLNGINGTNSSQIFDGLTLTSTSIFGDPYKGFRIDDTYLLFTDFDINIYDAVTFEVGSLGVEPDFSTNPILFDGKVYFHNTGGFVYETDGTFAGTKKVSSNTTGSFNFDPYMAGHDGVLFYSTVIGNNLELWAIDLETDTDSLFTVVRPAASSILDPYIFPVWDKILYPKYTSAQGNEMWVYDPVMTSLKDEVLREAGFQLYPNPVSDHLYITYQLAILSSADVLFLNNEGKLIKTLKLQNAQQQINLAELSSGLYHVYVQSGSRKIYVDSFLKR